MRQHSRITFRSIFRIKVSKRPEDRLIGYVGDVSDNGLRLLSDTLMEVDSIMALRLRMRDKEGEMRQVDIEALCLWARENTRTGHFEAGFVLPEPSAAFTDLVNGMRAKRKVQA
ncbi:PilZ domain-containing protein [Pseudomonas sp. GD03944]|uniref:PilZ domain-containing protein n=1 Tax=Pseudomonas sp. GD03944 TaxID=2975409 RepID=UPI002447961A|nr:PilZ domain-containing protein [Pseudomonas sp. GD03944]MDH1264426.1 PilZ domain-containing protein [Pseudomonas sp. GD03944]